MPDRNYLNLHDQFTRLIYMKLHAQNQLYTSISFWDLKVLIASLGMSWDTWPTHVKFAALIDTYLHAKNQLYTSSSFWDIKILKSCNLIVQEHFCIFPIFADFLQTCGFNRIIRVVMVHDLYSKNLRITGLYFFAKSRKLNFGVVLGHYPQNEIFSQKSGSVSILPLRHPNFMRISRKILWAVLEKICLPTDILTADPFLPKGTGPKMKLDFLRIFDNHLLLKYLIFKRVYLIHWLYIGRFTKTKQKYRTNFWYNFSAYFSIKLFIYNTLLINQVSISDLFHFSRY